MLDSINNYSSVGTRKGMGGLASGLDTDELVKGMTVRTRSKISKNLQSKQTVGWKMDAYRSISSKLISLSSKYMSFASPTNLLSQSFFSSNTITSQGSNSKAVSVTGSSDILANLKIESVSSLASSAYFMTSGNASKAEFSTGEINLTADGKTINNLAGETINLTYNGVRYNVEIPKDFTGSDPGDIAAAFNVALSNVKTNIRASDGTYKTLDQLITMEVGSKLDDESNTITTLDLKAVDPADRKAVSIIGGSGKSIAALGIDLKEATSEDPSKPIQGVYDSTKVVAQMKFADTMAGKSMTFTFNGVDKTIKFPEDKTNIAYTDMDSLKSFMQSELDAKFGAGKITIGTTGSSEIGSLTFKTSDPNSTLTFKSADAGIMGFKGAMNIEPNSSNRIQLANPLSQANLSTALDIPIDGNFKIKINGTELSFSSNLAVKDIVDQINRANVGVSVKYLSTTDTFSVTATETGAHSKVEIEDVAGGGNLAAALFGSTTAGDPRQYTVTQGNDAKMKVDFGHGAIEIERSSNSFSMDGLNFTLNSLFDSTQATGGEAVTFTSKMNTDKMMEGIKEMVKDYNEMLAAVNKELSTKPNRKYPPLTKEQADEMTETQIKDWNAKAMEGQLFADPTVSALANELRFIFAMDVPGVGSLKDMGISTSTDWKDNGKIVIDEEKLKQALEERPDDVMRAFTAPKEGDDIYSGGIMTRMKSMTDKYAATTGEKGSLVRLAGVEGASYNKDTLLFKQLEMIEKDLDNLTRTLKKEEDRYFRQFTALEKYISQMNSQSSWLSGQMGGQ